MQIKTAPSKYFFSGDINLNPDTAMNVDLTNLTRVQLLDIIENLQTKVLVVGDLTLAKKALLDYDSGGSSSDDLDKLVTEVNARVDELEDDFDNLTAGEVKSVVYWSSTEW